MVPGYKTFIEASNLRTGAIPYSPKWIGAAYRLGYIKGVIVVGKCKLIPDTECERLRENPPKISRQEMFGGLEKA